MQQLKESYGIDVYFRGKKLYAGLAYNETGYKTVKYDFDKNVPSRRLQKGLVFKKKEDVKIKLTAISRYPDNTHKDITIGDEDGELRQLDFYNLSAAELNKRAKAQLDLLKYDGYRGTLKTFGEPVVKHGDKAVMVDNVYPERGGSFFVDSVETDYGPNGFNRILEIGKSAA